MKKFTAIFFIAAFVLTASCGKKDAKVSEVGKIEVTDSTVSVSDTVKEQESEPLDEVTNPASEEDEVCEDYSESDYLYEEGDYYDGGDYYEESDYYEPSDGGDYGDTGYGVTGYYDNGYGGYLCDYGTYTAENSDGRQYAGISVYNADGAMSADVYFYDTETGDTVASAFVYTDATEAFGDAINDTEVEMSVALDDPNFFYSDPSIAGGHLDVIVYYPMSKCYVKLTCGNGKVYEASCYP